MSEPPGRPLDDDLLQQIRGGQLRDVELDAALRENPDLMASGVEEVLRTSAVTMHFRRTATRDVEFGGQAGLGPGPLGTQYL